MIKKVDLLFDKGEENLESDEVYLTTSQIEAFENQSYPFLTWGEHGNAPINQRLMAAFAPNVPTFSHAGFSKDIGLDMLVNTLLARRNTSAPFIHYALSMAPVDTHTASYRMEILNELAVDKKKLKAVKDISHKLHRTQKGLMDFDNPHRFRDLEMDSEPEKILREDLEIVGDYVKAINSLEETLRDSTSVGLKRLHQYAENVKESSEFRNVSYAYDCFLNATNVEVKVTLSSDLRITDLVLLPQKEEETKKPEKRKISDYFKWLSEIGKKKKRKEKEVIHKSDEAHIQAMFQNHYSILRVLNGKPETYHKLIAKVFDQLIKKAKKQMYVTTLLEGDLDFYAATINYYDFLLNNKLPSNQAKLRDKKERIHNIVGIKNPLINLEQANCCSGYSAGHIVPNDFSADPDTNMGLLTGPNGGGKSRYVTSIGLMYVLAQNGLPVPAIADISLVDNILTQFVLPDDFVGDGRWKREVARIQSDVINVATPYSLSLIDDFGSGTSYEEAKKPGLEVLYALRRLGSLTLMNSHIHELANDIEEGDFPRARNMKMNLIVHSETNIEATYSIVEGRAGKSYASEIAASLGLTKEAIDTNIANRIEKGELPVDLIRK